MTRTETNTRTLAALVDAQLACLLELHALVRRQAEFVTAGDASGLLELLTAKRRLVEMLRGIARSLAPYANQAPATRRWGSAAQRHACARSLARCGELMEDILAIDGDCLAHGAGFAEAADWQTANWQTAPRPRHASIHEPDGDRAADPGEHLDLECHD